MGRPQVDIDPEQVYKLARLHTPVTEMANILGCSRQTLHDRFSTEIAKGRADCKQRLRAKQIEVALHGNVTMLIFLGKQMLGQKDKTTIESEVKVTSTDGEVSEFLKRNPELTHRIFEGITSSSA